MNTDFVARAAQLWCLPEHSTQTMDAEFAMSIAKELEKVARESAEESSLVNIEAFGTALAELFEREAEALGAPEDGTRIDGLRSAYLACAEAATKASTRKLIVWPEVAIRFTIPAEAKP